MSDLTLFTFSRGLQLSICAFLSTLTQQFQRCYNKILTDYCTDVKFSKYPLHPKTFACEGQKNTYQDQNRLTKAGATLKKMGCLHILFPTLLKGLKHILNNQGLLYETLVPSLSKSQHFCECLNRLLSEILNKMCVHVFVYLFTSLPQVGLRLENQVFPLLLTQVLS